MITLNGEQVEIRGNMTLSELLAEKQFRVERIAVEYNGTIPNKSEFDKIVIKDNDRIEVVSFMGGG